MLQVKSNDGTSIAYAVKGEGPALVLVDGALCYHDSGPGPKLAEALSKDFTVYLYDRRGRGESGNNEPYAIEREIEDLAAVISTTGGSAYVFGQSSGAVLALDAARKLGPKVITKLGLYEAPMIVDTSHAPIDIQLPRTSQKMINEGRRSEVVQLFLTNVGLPKMLRKVMQITPIWPKLKGIAHTLPYDFAITVPYQTGQPLPKDRWLAVTMPTWVGSGDKSPAWMQTGQKTLAKVLPNATYHLLTGQSHNIKPKLVSPELIKFFKSK